MQSAALPLRERRPTCTASLHRLYSPTPRVSVFAKGQAFQAWVLQRQDGGFAARMRIKKNEQNEIKRVRHRPIFFGSLPLQPLLFLADWIVHLAEIDTPGHVNSNHGPG